MSEKNSNNKSAILCTQIAHDVFIFPSQTSLFTFPSFKKLPGWYNELFLSKASAAITMSPERMLLCNTKELQSVSGYEKLIFLNCHFLKTSRFVLMPVRVITFSRLSRDFAHFVKNAMNESDELGIIFWLRGNRVRQFAIIQCLPLETMRKFMFTYDELTSITSLPPPV